MTTQLITEPNLPHADDFYQALIDMHQGLSDEQSQAVNARLILLLSNHVGELSILKQAMMMARNAE